MLTGRLIVGMYVGVALAHFSMYLPIMSVLATFLKDKGFSLKEAEELLRCLVKVDESHSRTTVSFTVLNGSIGVLELWKCIAYYVDYIPYIYITECLGFTNSR